MNANRTHANRPTARTIADRNRQAIAQRNAAASLTADNVNAAIHTWGGRVLAVVAALVAVSAFL